VFSIRDDGCRIWGNCTKAGKPDDDLQLQDGAFHNCMMQAASSRDGDYEPADCKYPMEDAASLLRQSQGRNVGWNVVGVAALAVGFLLMH